MNTREYSVQKHPQFLVALNSAATTNDLLDCYAKWVSTAYQGTGAALEDDWTDFYAQALELKKQAESREQEIQEPVDWHKLRKEIQRVFIFHEFPSGLTEIKAYGGSGFWQIYSVSNPNIYVQLTDQIEHELNEALVLKVRQEIQRVRNRAEWLKQQDRESPYYERLSDTDLIVKIDKALSEGWTDGLLCKVAMGAIELIRRRLRAEGITDFAGVLKGRVDRLKHQKEAKRQLPALRKQLAHYRKNADRYQASGTNAEELILEAEQRIREFESCLK